MRNNKLEYCFCINENCVILQDVKHIQVLICSHEWIISLQSRSRFSIAVFRHLCLWHNLNTANVRTISLSSSSAALWMEVFFTSAVTRCISQN